MKDKLELQKELKQKEQTLIQQLNDIDEMITHCEMKYEDLERDYKQVKKQLKDLNETIIEYNNKECHNKIEKLYSKYAKSYLHDMLAIPEYDILIGVNEKDFLQAKQEIFNLMIEYNKKYIRIVYTGYEWKYTIKDKLD